MLNIITENKDAKILVITPLLPNHKISKVTKRTIKRNNTSYSWISYSSNVNTAANTQLGLNAYEENHDLPPYLIKIDNDIELGRYMLDRMFEVVERTKDNVAYVYCNFKYKGAVNVGFDAIPFDVDMLLKQNYISSNSMIKTGHLKHVGGFVIDEEYKRLLDWCLWLKFLNNGFVGAPCKKAWFVAHTKKDSISAGTDKDYMIKSQRVHNDFVKPFLKSISGNN